jgi:hypothetical protein
MMKKLHTFFQGDVKGWLTGLEQFQREILDGIDLARQGPVSSWISCNPPLPALA